MQNNQEKQGEQTRQGNVVAPAVDILENEQELVVVADIPGAEQSKIKLDIQPPDFKLEAEVAGAAQSTTYVRSFQIEERIDVDRVNAEYNSGVLTVRLPKSSATKPRRIEVRSG